MVVVGRREEPRADQGAGFQIEGWGGLRTAEGSGIGFPCSSGGLAKIESRELECDVRQDALERDAIFLQEHGPQRLVTRNDLPERMLQPVDVERPLHPPGAGDVVTDIIRFHFLD